MSILGLGMTKKEFVKVHKRFYLLDVDVTKGSAVDTFLEDIDII